MPLRRSNPSAGAAMVTRKQYPVNQRQWISCPLNTVSNPAGRAKNGVFSESEKKLAADLLILIENDAELQRLITHWPKFSPEGKHIIAKLVDLVEEK